MNSTCTSKRFGANLLDAQIFLGRLNSEICLYLDSLGCNWQQHWWQTYMQWLGFSKALSASWQACAVLWFPISSFCTFNSITKSTAGAKWRLFRGLGCESSLPVPIRRSRQHSREEKLTKIRFPCLRRTGGTESVRRMHILAKKK